MRRECRQRRTPPKLSEKRPSENHFSRVESALSDVLIRLLHHST
ncbi:hypothetical protein [Kingella potus]|nr:hypothetical protein [Kingella potus]